MTTLPTAASWIQACASLALQTAVVLALAAASQPFVTSPRWRRRLWIAALLGSTLVLASTLTGFDQQLAERLVNRTAGTPHFLVRGNIVPQSAQLHADQSSTDAALQEFAPASPEDGTNSLEPTSAIDWPAYAWLAGTLLVGLAAWLPRLWLARFRLRPDGNLASESGHRVDALAAKLGFHRHVRVWMSGRLAGPIAFGVWRPTIGLPTDFWTAHAPAEQDAMLVHELAHLRARDPLWLALADALAALLWWHPAIWWARRRFRAACESAADEASVIVENGPRLLAGCLVALAARWQRTGMLSLLGMAGYRSDLGQRVDRLLRLPTYKPTDRTGTAPYLLLGLGNLAALAVATAVSLAILPSHATPHPTLLSLMSSSLVSDSDSAAPASSRDQAEPAPRIGADASAPVADGAKHDAAIKVSLPEVPGLSARAVRLLCTDALTRRLGQSELFSHVACESAGDRQIRITLTFRDPARATAEAWAAGWSRLKLQLEQLGGLEFREVHSDNQGLLARNECPEGFEVLTLMRNHAAPPADEEKLVVAKAPFRDLGSTNIAEASITSDAVSGEPRISIRFDESGKKRFAEITSAAVGRRLAFVVDGNLLMAPVVREAIRAGRCELTASDATFDPRFLARLLAHPLPGPVKVIAVDASTNARGATSGAKPKNQANAFQPDLESSPASTNRVIRIEVLSDGRLLHAGREQTLENFSQELKRLDHADLASNPVKVFVACKSDVPWEHFAAVVKACDEAGVRSVSLRQGVSESPLSSGDALLKDGKLLFEMGRFAEAKAKFQEAISHPSQREAAQYYLSRVAEAEARNAAGSQSPARFLHPTFPPKPAGQEPSTNSPTYSTLAPLNQDALVTRLYRVNPVSFLRALEQVIDLPTATPPTAETLSTTDGLNNSAASNETSYGFPAGVSVFRSIPFTTRSPGRNTESLQKSVRTFFTSLGIDLGFPSSSSTNAKAVFYHDRAGLLYTRLTLQEQDLVEAALHAVSQTPPMVDLAAQFFEIGEADAQALGLDQLGQHAKLLPSPTNVDGASAPKATHAAATPTTTLRGDQFDWPGKNLTNAHSIQLTIDDALRAARILTDAEARSLTDALMKRAGVAAMAAPRVTTLSQRQAQIQAVDLQTVLIPRVPRLELTPTQATESVYQTEKVPVGPGLDLMPIVTDEGRHIRVLAYPCLTTFLGYESAASSTKPSEADSLEGPSGSEPPSTSAPTPLFRVWRTAVHTTVPHEHSLMLLGPPSTSHAKAKDKIPVLGDIPLLGRLFRSESTQVTRKQILILVSPAIVDPAGNRVTPPKASTPAATPLSPSARQ